MSPPFATRQMFVSSLECNAYCEMCNGVLYSGHLARCQHDVQRLTWDWRLGLFRKIASPPSSAPAPCQSQRSQYTSTSDEHQTCLRGDIINWTVSRVNMRSYVLVITVQSVNDMSENILMREIDQFMEEFAFKSRKCFLNLLRGWKS